MKNTKKAGRKAAGRFTEAPLLGVRSDSESASMNTKLLVDRLARRARKRHTRKELLAMFRGKMHVPKYEDVIPEFLTRRLALRPRPEQSPQA